KTAKDSVYIPLTDKKLNKVHGGRIAYKTATQGVTSSLARCLEIIEQQEPRLFLDVTTSSVCPQPDASVVKENTMTHRKTDVELDTEESEDLEESQEIVDDQNTSQHEDFVIRSKKARKNDRRRLNKLTQQFNICSLKRNDIDSKYNSPHDEKLTRFKKGKDCKSQLNVKSGKCSKRKQKNRRKNSFELQIHHFKRKTASYYDIPNKLENTTENIYFFKSKKCNSSPVISSSNNSKDKADKDTYEITLPIDEDTRNINIKQEIREQKTTGWEYFNASKGDLSSIEFYNTVERMLDKKEHDKIIKKKIYQQKRVKKQLEIFMSQGNLCTDDLNTVIKKLTAFDLTEENEDMQQQIIKETFQLVSKRDDNVCNFLEGGSLIGGSDYKLIYRHYATLYFVFCVDSSESELGILDLIQVFVETLDKCFENVCELDLIFHVDKVHFILNELVMGGMVLETNMTEILTRIEDQNKLEKQELCMHIRYDL
ncbi:ap-3 complex subunit sigma-2-like protein, partial [Lasius niger]